jgi:hypothetical protein
MILRVEVANFGTSFHTWAYLKDMSGTYRRAALSFAGCGMEERIGCIRQREIGYRSIRG